MEPHNEENTSKKIVFSGINTKYEMKKVTGMRSTVPKTKVNWDENNPTDKSSQIALLKRIVDLEKGSEGQAKQNVAPLEECGLKEGSEGQAKRNYVPLKEIMSKLSGYKNQDVLKNRYDETTFITFPQTVDLLVVSELTCFYCKCFTPIFYKNVRQGDQWSLDRIDNNKGHSHDNVVISCLKCNLQRKRTSSNKFAMSKQLVLTRADY
jgi:hypothetical protein